MLLKAAINGARQRSEHHRLPVTPDDQASDAAACVLAGAGAIHTHIRARSGAESLEPDDVAETLLELRARVVVPVGISTGAWIVPDPVRRAEFVRAWTVLPDFASVNFSEPDAVELAELLLERGIAVEAGLDGADAACALADSGMGPYMVRVILEPTSQVLERALRRVETMEAVLSDAKLAVPRLLHGYDVTAWPLLAAARDRAYDVRIGFEDTLRLPDGQIAATNAGLVAAAKRALARARGVSVGN